MGEGVRGVLGESHHPTRRRRGDHWSLIMQVGEVKLVIIFLSS